MEINIFETIFHKLGKSFKKSEQGVCELAEKAFRIHFSFLFLCTFMCLAR